MEKEKNNRGIIVLFAVIIVFLLALVVLLATGTINFKTNGKNITSNNGNVIDTSKDNNNEETNIINHDNSNYIDRVFISHDGVLTLWSDGTYKYINGDSSSGTLGKYSLNDDKLVLYYMFSIDSNNKKKANVVDGMKTLKVVDEIKIIDEDITLNAANQPAREGAQNFYTNLYGLLKYYDDEANEQLGIN